MTIGEKIKEARKRRGFTLEKVSSAIGIGVSTLSGYENDATKSGLDPATLVQLAVELDDLSLLAYHCQTCPIRNHLMIQVFPDLNNIRRDPAIIASRLRKEMTEGADALDRLAERFSDQEFKNQPDYKEIFEREMEQVIDVKRGIEILEFELILSGIHSSRDIGKVYERQQRKCEDRGHHHCTGQEQVGA